MPLLAQKMIYRSDLQANRHVIYVFGDNLERAGNGGQAKEMRGEPNAFGIPTKRKPLFSEDAYLTDDDYEIMEKVFDECFSKIHNWLSEDRIIVFPSDGIGSGYALLEEKAPKIWKLLQDHTTQLYEFDYELSIK